MLKAPHIYISSPTLADVDAFKKTPTDAEYKP